MTFEQFTKELAEKKAALQATEDEYKRAGAALKAFYADTLGIDAQGKVELDEVAKMVGKIVDMKGGA
jgi:hypothetical protein